MANHTNAPHVDHDEALPDAAEAFGLEPRAVRAGFRTDFDVGRVYRLTSGATAVASCLAIHKAVQGKRLTRAERAIAAGAGTAYLGLGTFGLWIGPSQIALWFQRRPRRTLAASCLPLALLPVTGGAESPLMRLATIGAATGAGVRYTRRDAQLHGLGAGLVWSAVTLVGPRARPLNAGDHLTSWIGFMLAGRTAAVASRVAYDNRSMFDQLFEFSYEREDMQAYVAELRAALEDARAALVDSAHATPRAGVSEDDLLTLVVTSLGRLEERLGVLTIAARSDFDLDKVTGLIRPVLRGRGHLKSLESTSTIGAAEMRGMLQDRARLLTGLRAKRPALAIDVAPDVEVVGLARLALIGATVTAAATNAVRHAPEMTLLHMGLSVKGSSLQLEIVNDRSLPPAETTGRDLRRSGLVHLRRRIEEFGGTLDFGYVDDGYRVLATLPAQTEFDDTAFWAADIRDQVAGGIGFGTRMAAIKSMITVLTPRGPSSRTLMETPRRPPSAYALMLLPLVTEILGERRMLRCRWLDLEGLVMLAAAGLNLRAARSGYGLSTTWLNGFASRYAFEAPSDAWTGWRPTAMAKAVASRSQQRAYFLAALNALATRTPSRHGERSWADHIVSVGMGPLLMATIVNPAQPRTRAIDVASNERLAEVESLHDLADSFHAEHSAPPKMRIVADAVADDALRSRLMDSLDAIAAAEDALQFPDPERSLPPAVHSHELLERLGRLLKGRRSPVRDSRVVNMIWPTPLSYRRQTVGVPDGIRLGEYLAAALARRIWPARVRLEFDDDTLNYAPSAAIGSARFRRKAVTAMDLMGRKLNAQFPRGWDGMWQLRQVDLSIAVIPWTGTIECRMVAWAPRPSRARRAADRIHSVIAAPPMRWIFPDREPEPLERMEAVGASVKWTVYEQHEISDAPSLTLPSTRRSRPAVRRAEAVMHLHPQRYSQDLEDYPAEVLEVD
jgi:hypothetical protein